MSKFELTEHTPLGSVQRSGEVRSKTIDGKWCSTFFLPSGAPHYCGKMTTLRDTGFVIVRPGDVILEGEREGQTLATIHWCPTEKTWLVTTSKTSQVLLLERWVNKKVHTRMSLSNSRFEFQSGRLFDASFWDESMDFELAMMLGFFCHDYVSDRFR